MFEKLAESLKNRITQTPIGPRPGGEDPIAAKTEWGPLVHGGSSFKARCLVQTQPERFEMQASKAMALFCSVFIGIGVLACAGGVWLFLRHAEEMIIAILMLSGFSFAMGGAFLYRVGHTPIVFDRAKGCFWRDRKSPDQVFDPTTVKDYTPLSNIHAIQLLSERVRTKESSFISYELNLVLKDASRRNVVDQADIASLRKDADTLARFLGVPVWDYVSTVGR